MSKSKKLSKNTFKKVLAAAEKVGKAEARDILGRAVNAASKYDRNPNLPLGTASFVAYLALIDAAGTTTIDPVDAPVKGFPDAVVDEAAKLTERLVHEHNRDITAAMLPWVTEPVHKYLAWGSMLIVAKHVNDARAEAGLPPMNLNDGYDVA